MQPALWPGIPYAKYCTVLTAEKCTLSLNFPCKFI